MLPPGASDNGWLDEQVLKAQFPDNIYAILFIIPAIAFTIACSIRACVRLQNVCLPLLRFGRWRDGWLVFLITASVLSFLFVISVSIAACIQVVMILKRTVFSGQWFMFFAALVIFFGVPGFLLNKLFDAMNYGDPGEIWRGANAEETEPDSTERSRITYIWNNLSALRSEDSAVDAEHHPLPAEHEEDLGLEDQRFSNHDDTLEQMEVGDEDEAKADAKKKKKQKKNKDDRERAEYWVKQTGKALAKVGRFMILPFEWTIVLGDRWGREVERMNRRRQAAQRARWYRDSEYSDGDLLLQ